MPVVTAASLVAAPAASSSTRVDPAAVDLAGTHAVDITAWLAVAAAQSPAA
ncbi:hypothetical protein [Frigoribacterium faeni]|uniref:hypothetical protein n=1 Tax=Frigoribacterium faeni TaxID=145483 RepID=UPI00141AF5DD|nr:hypothetical protein [Frigoribacterium faeni]NIJ04004.1 hypothetical protein [Frigoribacterium faeni]